MDGLDLFLFAVNVGLATYWLQARSFGWCAFFVVMAGAQVLAW